MKAIIAGTPIQIEGEPAEIAQLVEVLGAGAVRVEHVHHWRINDLDGSATVKGSCWCGQTRDFDPHLPEGRRPTSTLGLGAKEPDRIEGTNPVAIPRPLAAARNTGPRPLCERCGRKHKVGNCGIAVAS